MSGPGGPAREAIRRSANRVTSVELARARDLELHRELSERLVGDRPGLMRILGQALMEAVPLFVWREFEVEHHDRSSDVGSRLPEGRSFIATP